MTAVLIYLASCDGPTLTMVDVAICRARTRRRQPPAHVLEELRVAAQQGRR